MANEKIEKAGIKVKDAMDSMKGIFKKAEYKKKAEERADTPLEEDPHEAPEAGDKQSEEERPEKKQKEAKSKEKKEKIDLDKAIEDAVNVYNYYYTAMADRGMFLFRQRERAADLITMIENLVNSIANHPKSFDRDVEQIEIARKEFTSASDFGEQELRAAKKSAEGALAGIAAGTAVASLAPSVAMWVATTFGTASTGTAISTLSGAAATKAALAWLGGGALAAGGHGMAGGSALLAMSGPVGWSVAGVSILSSVVLFAYQKKKQQDKKMEELSSIKNNTLAIREADLQIQNLYEKHRVMREELSGQYEACLPLYASDFSVLNVEQQMQLGTLVNNTKSLAALMNKTVSSSTEE